MWNLQWKVLSQSIIVIYFHASSLTYLVRMILILIHIAVQLSNYKAINFFNAPWPKQLFLVDGFRIRSAVPGDF